MESTVSAEFTNLDLAMHRISNHDAYYVPNFVTANEEEYLIRKITESPQQKWKNMANRRLQIWGGDITTKGTLIAQTLPAFIDGYPDIVSRIRATGAFESSPHGAPNHVILNEYLPGQGIMPHEDGPRYYPVVATLTLGSHAVFHYYKYQSETDDVAVSHGQGRSIDTSPALSVLLERRSLIISSGAMYTAHLHGIDEVAEDVINPLITDGQSPRNVPASSVTVANLNRIHDEGTKRLVTQGVALKRGTRYSMTCRDVGRVSKAAF
ncbi:hypothetical protein B0H34DRAFT_721071 [Crassisporium funariophilum]|nr:hypothetical protein B0H34DRAFT_721071 [Crassisporium funariophilum]